MLRAHDPGSGAARNPTILPQNFYGETLCGKLRLTNVQGIWCYMLQVLGIRRTRSNHGSGDGNGRRGVRPLRREHGNLSLPVEGLIGGLGRDSNAQSFELLKLSLLYFFV
jgi:hypothetical protein